MVVKVRVQVSNGDYCEKDFPSFVAGVRWFARWVRRAYPGCEIVSAEVIR
jgi:hypothetical protein